MDSIAHNLVHVKDDAKHFLEIASSGDVRKAFQKFVAPTFRHHNIYFKGDAASLMAAMEENNRQYPDKNLSIRHVIQDGDMVAIYSHVRMSSDDKTGMAVVHMFRFEDGKIAELWDVGQKIPEKTPNQNGMF